MENNMGSAGVRHMELPLYMDSPNLLTNEKDAGSFIQKADDKGNWKGVHRQLLQSNTAQKFN